MNHLIFGGSGFIGTHLKDYISKTLSLADPVYSYDIKKKVSEDFTILDIRQRINLKLDGVNNSVIYNLAAVHTTPGHPDHEYFETNIFGAQNVCDFARKNNINTIVFTSSIAPYGASEDYKTEETLPMPNTPYGISKLTAEYIHKLWQSEDPENRKLIIVRPGVVFGKEEGGNFTRLYNSLKKGFFFYPGRKDTIKACVYVKDVARILYEAGQKEKPGHITFNLTYFPAPTIEEICITMAKATHIKAPKILVPGWALKTAAGSAYFGARVLGKNISGIHPDRVKKLMISTNISGEKLSQSPYKLQFSLMAALTDWYNDCESVGLY
ncbi:N-acetyl-alpha-D-glucosaminyl-diphospho-ditrans, octacis-undecaprenol 4-epimerase [Pedobacter sp. Bi27]|uniref:NAD-dependent epimerase/dehydratase family protein n=1 Tax=unclassified Pedobacter TaxID=2628915 RepID=UPI001E07659C|nr:MULTISPECIES: NAD(P)-dependent oxidoreductase [unclassified Pedobacter]CAH0198941.1 N-acetyl-alpha-D-glucosaminyl-diphospho-ditrans, octacis-undecaprenol 4-epimerase [Pedobacter sp. Bi36]CAH0254562.1 N-acetyl-alpha-D-glucosaminyl-diphospho-ditrans, octacis-undecaprenol 4-epimerase [Pedobacter sp. Bi126]CAH0308531.1 N-acetyl-alpha-D-glucosaminyl-diphospho-ditrans, octacis-undecaprenol 4-epimerase [Pedobacter sp. Bi27]